MIVMIFVTQNNFLNGPGISDRLSPWILPRCELTSVERLGTTEGRRSFTLFFFLLLFFIVFWPVMMMMS